MNSTPMNLSRPCSIPCDAEGGVLVCGPAVLTGLFPTIGPSKLRSDLVAAVRQGVHDAVADVRTTLAGGQASITTATATASSEPARTTAGPKRTVRTDPTPAGSADHWRPFRSHEVTGATADNPARRAAQTAGQGAHTSSR